MENEIEIFARKKALEYEYANDFQYKKIVEAIIQGAKWQKERDFNEKEINNIFYSISKHSFYYENVETVYLQNVKDEFEQIKKK
jgi:hypothetical protein